MDDIVLASQYVSDACPGLLELFFCRGSLLLLLHLPVFSTEAEPQDQTKADSDSRHDGIGGECECVARTILFVVQVW